MAFIAAKCTQCGANIEVDDSKEAGICKYCGTAFVTEKAINNYNTFITNHNDFAGATIIENHELTKLLEAAKGFHKLEKLDQEQNTYLTVSQQYPQCFDGWFGLMLCDMKRKRLIILDKKSSSGIELNQEVISNAKKIADGNQLAKVEFALKAYYDDITKMDNKSTQERILNISSYFHSIADLFGYLKNNKCMYAGDRFDEHYTYESAEIKVSKKEVVVWLVQRSDDYPSKYVYQYSISALADNGDFTISSKKYIYLLSEQQQYDERTKKRNEEFSKSRVSPRIRIDAINENGNEIILKVNDQKAYRLRKKPDQGCYIATNVYGSYDCPQVWTLRRFRDDTLDETWYGRFFIKCYYAISPTLVKWFGKTIWFNRFWRKRLDKMVFNLNYKGVQNTKYNDKY